MPPSIQRSKRESVMKFKHYDSTRPKPNHYNNLLFNEIMKTTFYNIFISVSEKTL
jgi:hypothetical protein